MKIVELNKEMAIKYSDEIVGLHNLIPFQRWSKKDLFLERDVKRVFKYKWDISSLCFIENILSGFCIAFEDAESEINGIRNFLYLHRIAVCERNRLMDVGTNLIRYTCEKYKKMNLEKTKKIIVKTPINSLNGVTFDCVEDFYLKLGFERIGLDRDKNKVDAILIASLSRVV